MTLFLETARICVGPRTPKGGIDVKLLECLNHLPDDMVLRDLSSVHNEMRLVADLKAKQPKDDGCEVRYIPFNYGRSERTAIGLIGGPNVYNEAFTLTEIATAALQELSGAGYIYEQYISGAVDSVAHKKGAVLTDDWKMQIVEKVKAGLQIIFSEGGEAEQ